MEWILWSPKSQTALIVIPEETELLIPIMRAKSAVHLITYAAPFTKDMEHFNNLSYYVLPPLPSGHRVPQWLSIQLGMFAGRLYADFSECAALAKYLEHSANLVRWVNPARFLLEWLVLRRKGQDVMHTPVGYVCQGRSLREDHPFFVSRQARLGDSSVGLLTGPTSVSEDPEAEVDGDGGFEDDY